MKSLVFNGEEGIEINYIFQKSKSPSDTLIVSFPGAVGHVAGGEWGYIMTVQQFNVNALYIRTDPELNRSCLTFHNKKPTIENTIKALIDQCAEQAEAKRIIAVGSSMGGFCSLYYGLKYDYDIISGSAQYTLTDPREIIYAVGGTGEKEKEWFNEQIRSVISEAGKRGYNKKIFLSWGEGEGCWKSLDQGQKLIKDLKNANIQFTYKLYPYSDHNAVHAFFPNVLKAKLGYYLGLQDEPSDDETELKLSPEAKLFNDIKESYTSLLKVLNKLPKDTKPFTSIKGVAHYGESDLNTALRNFVYIEQGWYWGGGYSEPIKVRDKNAFWSFLPQNKIAEGVCFWFQDTLLNYHEQKNEPKALAWCAENARQYLEYICRIADPKHNEQWWNSLRRMHFFMALHKLMTEQGTNTDWCKYIPEEICRDLVFYMRADVNVNDHSGHYRRALGLLHVAVYFKENKEFYDNFYNIALEILNKLTDFYFDKNGVCIFLQFRDHCVMAQSLMLNVRFIEENSFPETKELRTLKRKYSKIVDFAAHIIRPDGIIAAIGHSVYQPALWIESWVDRKSENYILRESNIAILNDEKDLSYITVNGGSNTHAVFKHCDLLSFTWWYDKVQVFMDSEGGAVNSPTADYAVSAIAHNGIVVDDQNYIIPSFENFTTIDEVNERNNYVMLSMSHNYYEGVTLKRRLMWIKPNIIVLYDEAISDVEHKYTQNFILQNWNVDKKNKSNVNVSVAPNYTVTLTQVEADDYDFDIEAFYGTANISDEEHFRGSLVSAWNKLRKGCNLAYSKKSTTAKFLTAIEIHGASKKIAEQEKHISSVKAEFDKLAIKLEDGTEIIEDGLEELRKEIQENAEKMARNTEITEETVTVEVAETAEIVAITETTETTGKAESTTTRETAN